MATKTEPATTIMRMPDVCAMVGLSKSQVYKLIRRGEFPAPVSLGCNAVGWPSLRVGAWIAEKIGGQAQA